MKEEQTEGVGMLPPSVSLTPETPASGPHSLAGRSSSVKLIVFDEVLLSRTNPRKEVNDWERKRGPF